MITNPVRLDEWKLLQPYVVRGDAMLELGNKINTKCGASGDQSVTYKEFFESLGVDHVSVDINGQDGALPIDLRGDLRLALDSYDVPILYDVVTNIGTTEHVVDQQEAVWRNLWGVLKVGGVLLSITPKPGDWRWHGDWYPRDTFYERLAALNGMEDVQLGTYGDAPRRNLYLVGRKVADTVFQWPGDGLLYRNRRP